MSTTIAAPFSMTVREFNADGSYRTSITAVRRTPAATRHVREGFGDWQIMNAKGEYLTLSTKMLDEMNPGWRNLALVPRAIAICISPKGEEFFDGYGPMTKDREKATDFVDAGIAEKAVLNRFGRGNPGFWNSERAAASRALKEYRDWTYRIETVPVPEEVLA